MKVFLKNTILFFVIFIVAYFSIIVVIINLNRKIVEKCQLNENTKSLIIGDSHTMVAINDANIKNLQNVSLNGEAYIYTFAKLRHILNNEPNITEVFLAFSYHNLSSYYDEYTYGNRAKYFFHRYIGVLSIQEYQDIYFNSSISNTFELLQSILKNSIKPILKSDCVIYGSYPTGPLENIYDIMQVEKRIQYQYYNKTDLIDISALNIKYLNKIIDLCDKKNIKLILLQTPMSEDYISMVPKKYIQYSNNFIQAKNLDLFNFSNLELPNSCFVPDGDHVNYEGAVLTSNAFKAYFEERNNE